MERFYLLIYYVACRSISVCGTNLCTFHTAM